MEKEKKGMKKGQESRKLKRKVGKEREREERKVRVMLIFIAVVNDCRQISFLKSSRKEYHIICPNNIFQRATSYLRRDVMKPIDLYIV